MKDLMGSHRMILLFQIFDLNIPKIKTKHLALFSWQSRLMKNLWNFHGKQHNHMNEYTYHEADILQI